MARFIVRLLTFLSLQAVVFATVLLYADPHPNGYEASAIDKHRRLRETKGGRLILVGGSCVPFGFDSQVLEERCGLAPVNMGVHVNLGLDYMLAEVTPHVRAGDVVVLSPEYENFEHPRRLHRQFWRAALYRPEAVRLWGAVDVPLFFDEGLAFIGLATQTAWARFYGELPPAKPYSRDSFNEYGDVVAHRGVSRIPLKRPLSDEVRLREVPDRVERIAEAVRAWESRGARAFVSFPPVSPRYYQARREMMDAVITETRNQLGERVLPSGQLGWPIESFFDTDYHLTREAMKRRAADLAERIAHHSTDGRAAR